MRKLKRNKLSEQEVRNNKNKYMKKYLPSYRSSKKEQWDYLKSQFEQPELDISKINETTKSIKDAFSDSNNKHVVEDDIILKSIEKYSKYIPIVMQFIKGFQAAASDFQIKQQSQHQPQNQAEIKAPLGWIEATPLQRLNYKYTRSEWYNQGLRYDEYIQNGFINPAINTGYIDPGYNDEAERRRIAITMQAREVQSESKTLKDLSKKYPEPPLVANNISQQNQQNIQQEKVKQSMEQKQLDNTMILEELQKDNALYLQKGVEYINSIPRKEFEDFLNNKENIITKLKIYIPFLPIHVKSMIINTTSSDFEDLLRIKCPERYEWLKEINKLDIMMSLFEEIKKQINI